MEIAQTNYRSCALAQSTRRAGLLMTHALARKRSQLSTIAVQIEVRHERITGTPKSVSLRAIGGGVWALVAYFEWRVRFQRRILSDAKNAGRAA